MRVILRKNNKCKLMHLHYELFSKTSSYKQNMHLDLLQCRNINCSPTLDPHNRHNHYWRVRQTPPLTLSYKLSYECITLQILDYSFILFINYIVVSEHLTGCWEGSRVPHTNLGEEMQPVSVMSDTVTSSGWNVLTPFVLETLVQERTMISWGQQSALI